MKAAGKEQVPRLVGGQLCLDFANTIDGRGGERQSEFLHTYADMIAWARHAGILSDDVARHLSAKAAQRPEAASAALNRAVTLRETIYRIFSAMAQHIHPPDSDLDFLRRAYIDAIAHARLARAESGIVWRWPMDGKDLDRPLWPIVQSAMELLATGNRHRIKECPGGGGGPCTWLFVDTTKNAIRRWCSMEECGSEAKARRLTIRRRAARSRRSP